MASVRLLATSTIVTAALIAGFNATAPANAQDKDPVAAAKAGPLSPGVKEIARNGTGEQSPALTRRSSAARTSPAIPAVPSAATQSWPTPPVRRSPAGR